jgi:hypothetical protein
MNELVTVVVFAEILENEHEHEHDNFMSIRIIYTFDWEGTLIL